MSRGSHWTYQFHFLSRVSSLVCLYATKWDFGCVSVSFLIDFFFFHSTDFVSCPAVGFWHVVLVKVSVFSFLRNNLVSGVFWASFSSWTQKRPLIFCISCNGMFHCAIRGIHTPQTANVVIQCCAKNLQIKSEIRIYLRYLNSLDVIIGIVLHFHSLFEFKNFHKLCTMRCVLDKITFLTIHDNNPQKFFSLVLLLKRFATRHINAFVKTNFEKPTKHNRSNMPLP